MSFELILSFYQMFVNSSNQQIFILKILIHFY